MVGSRIDDIAFVKSEVSGVEVFVGRGDGGPNFAQIDGSILLVVEGERFAGCPGGVGLKSDPEVIGILSYSHHT